MKLSPDQYHLLKSYITEELGFLSVGVAAAEFMEPEARRLEAWLNGGNHAKMNYMENHFDLRVDPTKLVPGAKTVISLLYNYYSTTSQSDPDAPKISTYAYGRDYHKVIRKKMKLILRWLQEHVGEVVGRGFVDSAPVMERDWASRAGLGWMGKHTLLINQKEGSYFFLAELIVDIEIEEENAVVISDHCGTCTRCIDACPTDAISESGYILDASKCISYLTIELKEDIPSEYTDSLEQWMFGCDICQDVCPWNRFSKPHQEQSFIPKDELLQKTRQNWIDLTEDDFDQLFEGSAVKRAGFAKLKANINQALASDQ